MQIQAIAKANRAGRAAVLTVHPREIDPHPPRIALPPRLRFAHYFRLAGFGERLRAVLRSGTFQALATLVAAPSSARSSSS